MKKLPFWKSVNSQNKGKILRSLDSKSRILSSVLYWLLILKSTNSKSHPVCMKTLYSLTKCSRYIRGALGRGNESQVSLFHSSPGDSKENTSPLIVFQSHSLFECWIERNRVRTLLVQVSQDEGPYSGVELPDPGRHDRDGECCFVMGGHFLLPLFLGAQRGEILS